MKSAIISFDLKRFAGIKRDYTKEDVEKLKGTFNIEHSLSKSQSEKLWNLLNTETYVNTLGSLSGNQAVQHAKAGLKAIWKRVFRPQKICWNKKRLLRTRC